MEDTGKTVETCRLCDEISEKLHSVFDETEGGQEILQLIKENVPIVIYKTDPLSKQICEKCLSNLLLLASFKRVTRDTQQKHIEKLKSVENGDENDSIKFFLGCDKEPEIEDELKDVCTSTQDLTILCSNCKQAILDASTVNGEIELSGDLHRAIAESLQKNRDKVLRKRKIQPIYQELDDSLCSSLTEFTRNTEEENGSQYGFDMNTESESETDDEPPLAKRRKIETEEELTNKEETEQNINGIGTNESEKKEICIEQLEEVFKKEPEYTYEPLTLLELALNAINKQNVPNYDPPLFNIESTHCECMRCGEEFQNLKLLALHETLHMDIELGEKIDHPMPWTGDGIDVKVRNKWLTYFDENGYDEEHIVLDEVENTSLLIPLEESGRTESTKEGSKADEIVLVGMKPMVNGLYLGDYTKEERKAFYQSMRIGGLTKKFCHLCRYSFKDNWAIESHYFSMACYYTCRYCGMRFNKQRHRFDEHVTEHVEQNHAKSEKIFAASKINNIVPKVIHPDKVRKVVAGQQLQQVQPMMMPRLSHANQMHQYKARNLERRSLQPNLVIKDEPKDETELIISQTKTANQAYFCRKCYKVFFKLDEFNVHSRNCELNQFPAAYRHMQLSKQNHSITERTNGDVSSTGRPVRNCAKDIGPYKDELYIPKELLRETVNNHQSPQQQPQQQHSFVCHICSTPFPTIYSRNSHMRIHKGELAAGQSQKQKQNYTFQQYHAPPQLQRQTPPQINPHQHYSPPKLDISIKQEPMDDAPMEPMVEIHEGQSYPSPPLPTPTSIGGGAVSITPIIKNTNRRPKINPSVMELVQNNPNITIKKKNERMSPAAAIHNSFNMPSGSQMNNEADKSYKCSSCWEAFSNKSHLYFHKKNQCEGSRFPCPFCKKRFGTEAAYSSHIFYSHPE